MKLVEVVEIVSPVRLGTPGKLSETSEPCDCIGSSRLGVEDLKLKTVLVIAAKFVIHHYQLW